MPEKWRNLSKVTQSFSSGDGMCLKQAAPRRQVLKHHFTVVVNGCRANEDKKPRDHWMTCLWFQLESYSLKCSIKATVLFFNLSRGQQKHEYSE